jgi:hypothetical protein
MCVREYVSMDVMGSLVCVEGEMVVSSVCKFECKGVRSIRYELVGYDVCKNELYV